MNPFQQLAAKLPQWDSLTWVALLLVVLVLARAAITTILREGETRKGLIELVDSGLIALVLVFFIIRPFIVQAFYIPSGSMEPTLYGSDTGGDRILVCKWLYRFRDPKRQEIVVFNAPPEADDAIRLGQSKDFIKRLIGLPGDTVEVKSGSVWVNGEKLSEPYIKEPPNYQMKIIDGRVYSIEQYMTDPSITHKVQNTPAGKIPEGKYLVFGDNRNNSNDSHKWGLLDRDRVLGRAMFIFWPLNRIRLLDGTENQSTANIAKPAPPAGTPAYAD